MGYINKDILAAEIEKMVKRLEDAFDNPSFASYEANLIAKGGYRKLKDILSLLDTFETKEVDLEKEIDKIWNPRFNLGWDEKSLLSMNHEGFTTIAKNFYELGLKRAMEEKPTFRPNGKNR